MVVQNNANVGWMKRGSWGSEMSPLPLPGALKWASLERTPSSGARAEEVEKNDASWLSSLGCHELSREKKPMVVHGKLTVTG